MSKLKSKNTNVKISAAAAEIKLPEKPHFSFEYLTSNDGFNFDYFAKDKRTKNEAKAALIDRLIEISSYTWVYWQSRDKYHGIETIYAKELNFLPSGYLFSSDEKVIIFRFFNQRYRIIGFKDSRLPTYYIIGFDFNYSAYEHGS